MKNSNTQTMPEGKEIDLLIGCLLFDYKIRDNISVDSPIPYRWEYSGVIGGRAVMGLPKFSSYIHEAWKIVDKLTDKNEPIYYYFSVHRSEYGKDNKWGYEARFGSLVEHTTPIAVINSADTAALAICRAALHLLLIRDGKY